MPSGKHGDAPRRARPEFGPLRADPYLHRLTLVSEDYMAGKALEGDAMSLVGTLRKTDLALDGLGRHPHTSNSLPNVVSAQHRRGAARHVRISSLIVESRACRARLSSHTHTRCAESTSGAARFAIGTSKALSSATPSVATETAPRQSVAALSVLEDGTALAIDGGDVAIEEGTRGVAQWARAKSGWCLVCRQSLTEPMAGDFLRRVGHTTVNADAVPHAQYLIDHTILTVVAATTNERLDVVELLASAADPHITNNSAFEDGVVDDEG
uniref:Uncharacterized protein n=1 Tax=Mycena chlorophos TaxID=658473 RepID=A0ABQ0L181_MYCCL|nr:predicted protein [Mycena chlorophos]